MIASEDDSRSRMLSAMSLWVDWLTVWGLVLLTVGTGAQAWGALAEFKTLWNTISETKRRVQNEEIAALYGPLLFAVGLGEIALSAHKNEEPTHRDKLIRFFNKAWSFLLSVISPGWPLYRKLYLSLFRWGTALNSITEKGDDDTVRLARFIRQALVWGILMVGSALVLVGAVVVLIDAH